jgi:predicted peptidase
VFLHGYGESGSGSADELPLLYATGIPFLLANHEWPASRPFVVLSPQNPWETDDTIYERCLADPPPYLGSCLMKAQHDNDHPVDGAYCFTPDEVHAFIRYALRTYNVDPRRVYVTGLSCGGFATWEYASEHPREVAAIVPISGEGRPAWQTAHCRLSSVPAWAFHGLLDDTVDPLGSIVPANGARACHPDMTRLTLYPDADHDAWSRTYDLTAGHNIYDWMLRHRR